MSIEYRESEPTARCFEDIYLDGRNIGRMYHEHDGTFRSQIIPAFAGFGVTGFGKGATKEEAIRNGLLASDQEIQSSIKGVAWIRATMEQIAEVAA